MEQIIVFAWLFLALVVNAVDGLSGWLTEQGWLIVPLGLFVLFGFHAMDKWSIQFAGRVEAIEKKLGIQYTPPVKKKSAWWTLLAMFVLAVYMLGKSLQAEGLRAPIGIILSCLFLLLCAFVAYCFIDEAVRDYWSKKRERQEWIDKVSDKETDC